MTTTYISFKAKIEITVQYATNNEGTDQTYATQQTQDVN